MPQKAQIEVAYPQLTNAQQLVAGYYVFNPSRGDVTDGPFALESDAVNAITTGQTVGGVPGPAIAGTHILHIVGDPTTTLVAYNCGKIWDKVVSNINGTTFNRTF